MGRISNLAKKIAVGGIVTFNSWIVDALDDNLEWKEKKVSISDLVKKVLVGGLIFLSPWAAVAPDDNLEWKEPITIVLDAGHSWKYKGTGDRNLERYINKRVTDRLGEKLDSTGRYNVVLTRKDHGPVDKGQWNNGGDFNGDGRKTNRDELLLRNLYAKFHNADLFASIHFDYNKKRTESKMQIICDAGDRKSFGNGTRDFWQLREAPYAHEPSKKYAIFMNTYLINQINPLTGEDREIMFLGSRELDVLDNNAAKVAMLIECDNLANKKVRKFAQTPEGIEHYANTLFKAIEYAEAQNWQPSKLGLEMGL